MFPKELENARSSLLNPCMNEKEWWWLQYYHHNVEPPKRFKDEFIIMKGLFFRCYTVAYERVNVGL